MSSSTELLDAEGDAELDDEGNAVFDKGNVVLDVDVQRRHVARLAQQRLAAVVPVGGPGDDVHTEVSIGARLLWKTEVLQETEGRYRVQTAGLQGWSASWGGAGLDRAEQQELAGILELRGRRRGPAVLGVHRAQLSDSAADASAR